MISSLEQNGHLVEMQVWNLMGIKARYHETNGWKEDERPGPWLVYRCTRHSIYSGEREREKF